MEVLMFKRKKARRQMSVDLVSLMWIVVQFILIAIIIVTIINYFYGYV